MKKLASLVLTFIAVFPLLALGSNVGALSASNAETTTSVSSKSQVKLSGQVTVDGKPRKGVVVSDGISVVTTDASGKYTMTTSGQQYVFVSVPADCKLPVEDGFPKFYQEIKVNKKKAEANFALTSQAVADDFKLLTIADIQVGDKGDAKIWETEMLDDQIKYAQSLTGNVIGISLGDIVWNNPSMYPTYKKNITKLGVPIFSVIGNHDHNENVHGDAESDRDFRNALGPTYYSYNIGEWHLIALDDVLYSGVRGRNDYEGGITEAQIEWLKQDLAHVDKNKSIIVGLHIPTKKRYAKEGRGMLNNSVELYDILKDYHNVQILSGHTHFNCTTDIAENITETTFAAAMGAFWNGPINNDGTPRGFAVLEFKGNEIVDKYYMGASTPRDYQIKIYLPEEASYRFGKDDELKPVKVDSETLLVNVFFWHTDWNVQVKEDDNEWVTIERSEFKKILDPEAVKLLQGRNSWEKRPKAEPAVNNDHMFLYKPTNSAWKVITVKAIDTFGNEYTASVNNDK